MLTNFTNKTESCMIPPHILPLLQLQIKQFVFKSNRQIKVLHAFINAIGFDIFFTKVSYEAKSYMNTLLMLPEVWGGFTVLFTNVTEKNEYWMITCFHYCNQDWTIRLQKLQTKLNLRWIHPTCFHKCIFFHKNYKWNKVLHEYT